MGIIERSFEQAQSFCHVLVLNRYIFYENIMFVPAITQYFLKEKLLKNKPFYAKNAEMAGNG